jgi:peptidoglycan-associated lipoprotein
MHYTKSTFGALGRLTAPYAPNPKPIILMSTALFALAAGCGSDPVPPPKAAEPPAPVAVKAPEAGATAPARTASTSPTAGSVRIEDRILKACGDIPRAHFAFDSSQIEGDAAHALDALARCFVTGPLSGKGMKLVGHADPRGETEYNFGLGQKRAGSVAEFLGKKGLEKSRVETSSHGELEASGDEEESWAQDRRVDVFLAN